MGGFQLSDRNTRSVTGQRVCQGAAAAQSADCDGRCGHNNVSHVSTPASPVCRDRPDSGLLLGVVVITALPQPALVLKTHKNRKKK